MNSAHSLRSSLNFTARLRLNFMKYARCLDFVQASAPAGELLWLITGLHCQCWAGVLALARFAKWQCGRWGTACQYPTVNASPHQRLSVSNKSTMSLLPTTQSLNNIWPSLADSITWTISIKMQGLENDFFYRCRTGWVPEALWSLSLFEVFQPVITVPERYRQTDGQTDRQTTYCRITALCAVKYYLNIETVINSI